jgi:hypothetical protein
MRHKASCRCVECQIERRTEEYLLEEWALQAGFHCRDGSFQTWRTFVRMFEAGDTSFLGERALTLRAMSEMHRLAALIEA